MKNILELLQRFSFPEKSFCVTPFRKSDAEEMILQKKVMKKDSDLKNQICLNYLINSNN